MCSFTCELLAKIREHPMDRVDPVHCASEWAKMEWDGDGIVVGVFAWNWGIPAVAGIDCCYLPSFVSRLENNPTFVPHRNMTIVCAQSHGRIHRIILLGIFRTRTKFCNLRFLIQKVSISMCHQFWGILRNPKF